MRNHNYWVVAYIQQWNVAYWFHQVCVVFYPDLIDLSTNALDLVSIFLFLDLLYCCHPYYLRSEITEVGIFRMYLSSFHFQPSPTNHLCLHQCNLHWGFLYCIRKPVSNVCRRYFEQCKYNPNILLINFHMFIGSFC